MPERLQKVLAGAGVASRRGAEALIRSGRVSVNGAVIQQAGYPVEPATDVVAVDGRPVGPVAACSYLMLHKPPGYLSTVRDDRGRRTIMALVPRQPRVFPVGRLDRDSEGLLLMTNDGWLANRLTHPRFQVEKEYHVMVQGRPGRRILDRLCVGVALEEGDARAEMAEFLSAARESSWVRVVLRQGRKRQIRRMFAAFGVPVERLIRVRVDGVELDGLPAGRWRALSDNELATLEVNGR